LVFRYERLLFSPREIDWFIIITLSPLSLIYSIYMFFRRIFTKRKEFIIPIISVGNLVVGGSGKTPFIISLASNLKVSKIYIISRGYGRRSRGLIEVSRDGEILTDIYGSGDEAMLMANLSLMYLCVSEE